MAKKSVRPKAASSTCSKLPARSQTLQSQLASQAERFAVCFTQLRVELAGILAILPGYNQAAKAALDDFLVGSITTHLREHLGTSSREGVMASEDQIKYVLERLTSAISLLEMTQPHT